MGELVTVEQNAVHTPMSMIEIAVERGADVDQLTKLMELQERWEANEARKAFVVAMNAFKSNPPKIGKNKHVSFGNTNYDHATLDHVANVITAGMAPHGLSFRWEVSQGDHVSVTCIIMHQMGHQERVSLTAPADSSGSKNTIQAIGSTVTYLQRYTLLAATGLAAGGDDDGRAAEPVSTISDEQHQNLIALADEVKADMTKFLAYFKLSSLDAMPASWYDRAVKALEAKR
jgi:hypothetical protein